MIEAVNIYYKNYLAEIGGIETSIYNTANKYSKDREILFLIGGGHPKQIERLSQVGNVAIYDPKKQYYCKKLHVTYEVKPPSNIKYEKISRVSHGDLFAITKEGWMPPKFEVDEEYGVSKNTCESAKWYFGHECKLCPNPFIDEPVKPLLKLVSPQRMTWEKGKDRIIEFSKRLDDKRIPYQWLIFCNDKKEVEKLENPNLIWVKSRFDIKPFIKDADYLVLLSDCEGSPMAPQEALMVGTPIIVTDLPCYKDLKVDKSNSFLIKKDLSNLDVEEIYRKKDSFDFKWNPPKDIWGEILEKGKFGKMEKEAIKFVRVKANKRWLEGGGIPCADLGRVPKVGEEWVVTEQRAKELVEKGRTKIVGVVQEAKQKKKQSKEIKKEEK